MEFDNEEPLARNSDDESSHLAGDKLTTSGKRNSQKTRVVKWMAANNVTTIEAGLTSAEIAQYSGIDRYVVARRLPDLMQDGYVVKCLLRTCKATGNEAMTWRLVTEEERNRVPVPAPAPTSVGPSIQETLFEL